VLLGAHESIADGPCAALAAARERRARALQIFTANATRWAAPRRDPDVLAAFAGEAACRGLVVLAHASYLPNLASGDRVLARRSRVALVEELGRCAAMGIGALVLHPGSHGGDGAATGVRRVAAALRWLLARTAGVDILLENTAGQGASLGSRLAELVAVIEGAGADPRLGVCLDTCHLFAAGYDLRAPGGIDAAVAELAPLGPGRLRAFHLNDSRVPLGARVDRHAAVGEGHIGAAAMRRIVRHPAFADLPGVLELRPDLIPKSLARLRSK
jgi:deoxyribonuclease IV